MNNIPIVIPYGSMFKLQILIEDLPKPLTMDDVDFICEFGTSILSQTLRKRDLANPSPGVYIAPLYTTQVGRGEVYVSVSINIPDANYSEGTRTEIHMLKPNIIIGY